MFSINKRGDWKTKMKKEEFTRPSDVYVFCLLNHKDKETVNPLIMDQWIFYVIPTRSIDEIYNDQSSIVLSKIEKMTTGVKYNDLKNSIINVYKNIKGKHNGT